MNYKNFGFTLAELLITIAIVGVVAALTIPNLINNYKAHKYRTLFNKSVSTIQQAVVKMVDNDESLDPTSYKRTNSARFYETFGKYVNVSIDCVASRYRKLQKNIKPCYVSDRAYKTLNGTIAAQTDLDDGELVLQDGTNLLFEDYDNGYIYISVDIDGLSNGPNIWGYDLFTFQFVDGKVLPMGDSNTRYNNLNTYCNKNANNNKNGIACAKKAQSESDYFKWVVKNVK
jgi:prepilin-type N-terminal cleavage/methylation domain-containing protein